MFLSSFFKQGAMNKNVLLPKKRSTGLECANSNPVFLSFVVREESARYYLASPSLPTFSSPSKTNTGTRTHTTNMAQSQKAHEHAQAGGKGRSDAAQIEDSGERKHADCKFLRVRWFSFRLLDMGTPGLNCRVGTTWERAAQGHLLGALQPLFLWGS